jgi:hypothetical protein
MSFHVPEQYRIREGRLGTTEADGNNGAFRVRIPLGYLKVIASDGGGWEHASVSRDDRVPNWEEMCHVKGMFWGPEDVVMQLHPRESEYVNFHPRTLHLWRPIGVEIPTPPSLMVGPPPMNRADYIDALEEISRLIRLDPDPQTAEGRRLTVLAMLVEGYERAAFSFETPTPEELAEFRRTEKGKT